MEHCRRSKLSGYSLIKVTCRVHLQYLGHAIANDLQYGGGYWGPRPPFLIPGTAAARRMEVEGEGNAQPQLKRQKVIPIPADMQASQQNRRPLCPCPSLAQLFLCL